MLKTGIIGLIAIFALSLSSYAYQALLIAHLGADQYTLVMVGLGSSLITTALGAGAEIASVERHGRLTRNALAGLVLLGAVLSSILTLIGMLPVGISLPLILATGVSGGLTVFMSSSLGAAQAASAWKQYAAIALIYSLAKVALAAVCFDPFFALLVPGISAALGGIVGIRSRVPGRCTLADVLPAALRLAPLPLLCNIDMWLSSYWLGAAASAYRVPALLGRPFYYMASGLAPMARKRGLTPFGLATAVVVSSVPILCVLPGVGALLLLRPLLPSSMATFDPALLIWAASGQAAAGSLLLLINLLGSRAGWRWTVAFALLPLAFWMPTLAQLTTGLLAGSLLLWSLAMRGRAARLVPRLGSQRDL